MKHYQDVEDAHTINSIVESYWGNDPSSGLVALSMGEIWHDDPSRFDGIYEDTLFHYNQSDETSFDAGFTTDDPALSWIRSHDEDTFLDVAGMTGVAAGMWAGGLLGALIIGHLTRNTTEKLLAIAGPDPELLDDYTSIESLDDTVPDDATGAMIKSVHDYHFNQFTDMEGLIAGNSFYQWNDAMAFVRHDPRHAL